MKIKLVILESNIEYLNQIVSTFSIKYADKFQIYPFTNQDVALSVVNEADIDVFAASREFDINISALPKQCAFLYLTDEEEDMYKRILSTYSEKAGSIPEQKEQEETKLIAFQSPSGGVGSSTMAAAAALYFAAQGKKTLYLNLERFGFADLYFSADGLFDMSDIVFALKSKKANLAFKLENSVRRDRRGVYFYSKAKVTSDMLVLSQEEKCRLLSELKLVGFYDYIILDTDFVMGEESLKLYRQVNTIVWVGDGSEISNAKIRNAYGTLCSWERGEEAPLNKRLCIAYNKFSKQSGKHLMIDGVEDLGDAPTYENATTEQILKRLFLIDIFKMLPL